MTGPEPGEPVPGEPVEGDPVQGGPAVDEPDPYVPERGNPGYRATAYDLDLTYAVASNNLSGSARITVVPLHDRPRVTFDLVALRATKVTVDGRPAGWRQTRTKLTVTPRRALRAGQEAVVEIRYGGRPAPVGSTWGAVGWEELSDGVLVASQPSGACTWFPCNDLARQKAPFDVRVTATDPYRVVASGRPSPLRRRGSTTTWAYHQAEPCAPYLMGLHVGRYTERVLAAGPVAIRAELGPGVSADFTRAFARQVEMMDVFVSCFGPYPFEAGYRVVVCPEPLEVPLEVQGGAVFGTNHLDGNHERLIAHELAHQWFGNSLTASSWSDIWLHEGFCCYAEWLWSERSGGASAHDHARRHHARLNGEAHDLVLADPGPVRMFDDVVYKRGALTLHALRRSVGDPAFFDVLHRWTAEHRHGVVTTADFEALVARVVGHPMGPFFHRWLRLPALPELPDRPDSSDPSVGRRVPG